MKEENVWRIYNFVNDWKDGKFGAVDLQKAIDEHLDKKEKNVCCICGKEFDECGNNPWPVKYSGKCCDNCNTTRVIPARNAIILSSRTADK